MSCLFPKLIKNPRYLPNKKNGGKPPALTDKRVEFVPVSCGKCIECRKKRRREWMVRLSEELRGGGNPPLFVTLTISPEQMERVPYKNSNDTAKVFVKWFRENVRKKTGKSPKHYFVTELGENKGRIHLHGFVWANEEIVRKCWIYGFIHIGTFVNEKSINYMTKYMLKESLDKSFTPQVFASKGIGSNYFNRKDWKYNQYKENDTQETYRFRNGTKMYMPQYYRNKIYSDDEREKLWIEKQEKGVVYIAGEKIDIKNTDEYKNILSYYQNRAISLHGDNPDKWEWEKFARKRRKLEKYIQNYYKNHPPK